MYTRLLLSTLLLCSVTYLHAQSSYVTEKTVKGKVKKQFEKAKQYAFERSYERAISELTKVLKVAPNFVDAIIDRAEIHYDQKRFAAAEQDFEQAIILAPDYKARVYYMLGLAEMRQDKHLEAAAHFEYYANNTSTRNEKRKAKARRYQASALFLDQALKNPVPYRPERLSDNINTPYAEYLPTFTADEEILIYTARVPVQTERGDMVEQEDFFFSYKKDGEWQKGQPLTDINTPTSEGAQSISADGRFLVFTGCNRPDGYGSCDIYFSERRGDRWTTPVNIGSSINTKKWESLPALSADGQTMYFTSDRSGGLGGKDIYVSYRQQDGRWGTPKNIGAPINTPEDDQNPFFHPDGKTMYFMSKGHPTIGNYDLYVARKDENGAWQTPQNLGYPINTKGNEGALTVSLDGTSAYFASDRADVGNVGTSAFDSGRSPNGTDIYRFELYPAARPQPVTYVKAKVRDAVTKQELVATVDFVNIKTSQTHTQSVTDDKGTFLVVLPMGNSYALNVSKTGYLFHSAHFALETQTSLAEPYVLLIDLVPIAPQNNTRTELPKAKPIVLENIFFETGSAALLETSRTELRRLYELLLTNSSLKIQINGHTDNVGSEVDNQQLSTSRAKAVQDYLIEQGISPNRLRYKGFGEQQPIADNNTMQGRQQNRRTEFEVF